MCGFTGFLDRRAGLSKEEAQSLAERMNQRLTHRGPDDQGLWLDPHHGLVLAHRRLSILDLSSRGHQPMISPSGRYVVAYNGEIYNHLEIRKDIDAGEDTPVHPLEDQTHFKSTPRGTWQGHSDTETLLAAVERWGLGETLKRCRGMFAFALWDRQEQVLSLARDRLGEKPLYFGWQGEVFLFGSELKALRAHPAFKAEIDRASLSELLKLGYIPGPSTIFQGISKLAPGSFILIGQHRQASEPVHYWSVADTAIKGQLSPFTGSDEEGINRLDQLLKEVVLGEMISDVPLGSFLSGGIDSSLITAIMQSQSTTPIQTFSIGFEEEEYNEAPFARAVANHLGTDHTELCVSPEAAMGVISSLPELYDEPFADVSQIPTHLVARLAHQKVKVALTGDGGDEFFGGYNRHTWTPKIWKRIHAIPLGIRRELARMLTLLPPHTWDSVFRALGFLLPASLRYRSPGDKLHKISKILGARKPEDIYLNLITQTKDEHRLVIGASPQENPLSDPSLWPALREIEHRMMYLDSISYLPDDILVKLDRATMGTSLEGRSPFLDHALVEFAWSLPLSMKIRQGQGKWILRQLLQKYVPNALIERPKMGFGVPVDRWIREPLKDWGESLIDPRRLQSEGFLHPGRVKDLWQQHRSGRRNHAPLLWSILMFEAWLEHSL